MVTDMKLWSKWMLQNKNCCSENTKELPMIIIHFYFELVLLWNNIILEKEQMPNKKHLKGNKYNKLHTSTFNNLK